MATYARSFFALQLEFAEAVSKLSGLPLGGAVLDYTNVYIRLGLGRDFDPDHPTWREYVEGLLVADDRPGWTHQFHASRADPVVPPGIVATSGCFSYAWSGERIRLHFHDADPNGPSPLSRECRAQRWADLATLFAKLEHTVAHPVRVAGASWLYNIVAYRRLFPPSYLATARPMHGRFRHMPLWGQFLDRRGQVKDHMGRVFRDRLRQLSRLDELDACFPFQVLSLEAPAAVFHAFYAA